jgi:PAS domain S-box-containing protein
LTAKDHTRRLNDELQRRIARTRNADDADFLQSVADVMALAIERDDQERELLQTIFDNIPVMISVFDASGRLVRVNREWERVLGWTLAEAQRTDILAETYPDPEDRGAAIEFIRKAERRWGDFKPRTRRGNVVDVSWARFRLSDGSAIGFGLDVSKRKHAETERDQLLESERWARGEAEAALERLRAVESITDTALAHLDLDDLLRELLARVRRVLGTDSAAVLLLEAGGQALYTRAVDGYVHERGDSIRVRIGTGVTGKIAAEGHPMIVNDYSTVDVSGIEGVPPSDIRDMVQSVMGAPLRIGTKVVGVVAVNSSTPRHFTEEELTLLLLVADRVAPSIERARLVETVQAGQERLKALSTRLLTAHEEERRRLSVELHDELGQVLTAVKINLESLQRMPGAAALSGHLPEAIVSVVRAMETVRDLALNLRPAVLDDLGLPAALRWYADRFARDTGIAVHLSVEGALRVEPALGTACFRVAQEALTNVARHAQAQNVWLGLRLPAEGLELGIRDDGTGFNPAAAWQRAVGGGSLGLLGMEERVSLLGGKLEVRSSPGSGTEILARFPPQN